MVNATIQVSFQPEDIQFLYEVSGHILLIPFRDNLPADPVALRSSSAAPLALVPHHASRQPEASS